MLAKAIDPNIEAALIRAVCALIDTGEYALGKEEAETPEELAIVHFMRGLRIGSRVGVSAPNVWRLELESALRQMLACVEATGGVEELAVGHYAPVANREWTDLGAAYVHGCEVLGTEPLIEEV